MDFPWPKRTIQRIKHIPLFIPSAAPNSDNESGNKRIWNSKRKTPLQHHRANGISFACWRSRKIKEEISTKKSNKNNINESNINIKHDEEEEIQKTTINKASLDFVSIQIKKLFENNEVLHYDDLFDKLTENLGINPLGKDAEMQQNAIKDAIEKFCFKAKNESCFIKEAYSDEEVNKIRILLLEFINNSNEGVKKQQIKQFQVELLPQNPFEHERYVP